MKKHLALGLAITLTLTACGGGSDVKLPECIADESGKCTTKFEYDKKNRIVKINDDTITYADNLVTIGAKKYEVKGDTVTVDGKSFTIDKDGYIVKSKDGNLSPYKYEDGNLINIFDDSSPFYYYDDKKSPFSNSNTPKWVIQELFGAEFASKNNVSSSGYGINQFGYEYDSDGFPVKQTYYNTDCEEDCVPEITRYIYRGEPQNITPTEPAAATQEAAADNEPKFFECEDKEETEWRMGLSSDNCTRIVASSKKYTRAVSGSQKLKIKYIGKKKERREEREMDFYFASYETSCGFEYEIIDHKGEECAKTFFLYNDSEKWGGVPDNIVFKNEKKYPRLKASKDEIAAMEKLQNGRKIILTEVISDFSIEGKSNRLMLARYKNSKKDGLFQIVLRDHNNDYFTTDFPSGLDENGQPNWRADMGDEIGEWSLYFVGRVAEGLFLVTDWCAAEGCGITTFVAKNGKLENWQDKNIAEGSATHCSCGKEECEKEGPKTIEAVFLGNDDSDSEGLAYSRYRLPNGDEITLNGFAPDDVKKDDKVSVTFKVMESTTFGEGDVMVCADFKIITSVKKIEK